MEVQIIQNYIQVPFHTLKSTLFNKWSKLSQCDYSFGKGLLSFKKEISLALIEGENNHKMWALDDIFYVDAAKLLHF